MTTYVAVSALVLGYVALVAAYLALRTLAKLRRATIVLARGARTKSGYESLLEATSRYAEQTELVAERAELAAERTELVASEVDQLRSQLTAVTTSELRRAEPTTGALRHVALVRYDAFTEMSGRLSFSLALLDDAGNGVTLSAIAGRSDTRVYAKAVVEGKGEQELSPEEQQAVASARETKSGLLHRKSA